MKIVDRRNEEVPDGIRFDQLEQGWVVEGMETGYTYFVVLDHGFVHGKRLVNFNKNVLQSPQYCTGRYRRLFDVELVVPSQSKYE